MKRVRLNVRITGWFQTLTPQQRAWFPYLALALAVFAAYSNVYQNSFVWDDWYLVVYNDSLRHWRGLYHILFKNTLGPYYRPIQALFYFVVYQIFGLSEAAFHGANVLLQAANTCLMYRLGCRLGFYQRASFTAALLWGIHPLGIEAAAVVAGTADILVGSFCMMGLLVLLPAFAPRRSGAEQISGAFAPRKFLLASLIFVLALCSKESSIVFPALVTFTLFLVSKERLRPATYLRTWPLWLLVSAYLIGWSMCPALNNGFAGYLIKTGSYTEDYEHNFINRVITSFATLPTYLGLIVVPTKLHLAWDFPIFKTVWDWQVIAGAVIVAAALLQIIWGRGKRGLPLTWALLWFAAALSPYTGILKAIDGRLSEHWIYLPTIGLFLGVSQTVVVWMDALRSKKYFRKVPVIVAGLVTLATLGLGIETYLQNKILRNGGSMFEDIIKDNPTVWAHYGLGVYYFGQKEYDKAVEQWLDVEADSEYTQYLNKGGKTFMHNSLAFIYLNALSDKSSLSLPEIIHALPSSNHIPEAIEELKLAQKADPDACCASAFLAGIYYYLGDKDHGDYYRDIADRAAAKNKTDTDQHAGN